MSSRDSSVGKVTRLWAGVRNIFRRNVHTGYKTQLPAQVYRAPSSGVQWRRNEADQTFTTRTNVKNEWRYISTTPICIQGEHRDKFTFYLHP